MKMRVVSEGRQLQIYEASEIEIQQMQMSFRRRIPNAWWHPLVKKKLWDGYINFIDSQLRISAGLWDTARDVCEAYSFDLIIDGLDTIIDFNFDEDKFRKWVASFFENSSIQPREYQIDAALKILKWKRSVSEIATSAGKTLILFMVFAYLKDTEFLYSYEDNDGNIKKKQFLLIVPTVPLILQTYEKFQEYASVNKKFKFNIQTFGGGASKIKKNTDVIIGTFQTLTNLPESHYKDVLCVGCDECLAPDTMISMCDGTKKQIQDIEIGDEVITFNEITKNIENNKVLKIHNNLSINEKMFEFSLENGEKINITGNHKVMLIDNTWKRADELTLNDEIFSI